VHRGSGTTRGKPRSKDTLLTWKGGDKDKEKPIKGKDPHDSNPAKSRGVSAKTSSRDNSWKDKDGVK